MRKIGLIVPVIVLVALFASFAYAEEVAEEVIIDNAYTMDYYMDEDDPETEFCVWDPVIYNVDYTIFGKEGKTYKAIIIIKLQGKRRLRAVERHKPGTYTTTMIDLADDDDIGVRDVTYKIKLKRRGSLVDISDPYTSQITISECP
jgi:hypothetical protein